MVKNDTRTWLVINSRRMRQSYMVEAWREYSLDIDVETDADQFHIVINNPNGRYTGYFNKFDPLMIWINGAVVLSGMVDDIEYNWDESQSVIQLVGRDKMSTMVDNDALPGTQENVDRASYIQNKCDEYGIRCSIDDDLGIQDKVIIGANESEISVINNMLVDTDHRTWYIDECLHVGKWATNAPPLYTFTRGVPPEQQGVPIINLNLKDSGAELRSEVKIYGSTDDGDNKVEGVAKNDNLQRLNVKKRRTIRSSNNDSSSKYASSALRKIKEDFRSGIELTITVKTQGWDGNNDGNGPIFVGRVAHVIDSITKINSTFFIKSANYSKTNGNGSLTKLVMIPGDSTFNVLWTNTGKKSIKGQGGARQDSGNDYSYITGTATTTLAELMNDER